MHTTPRPSSVTPWKLLASSKALDEKWFPVRKDMVQLPKGTVIDDYFVWEAPHIVMVVPVTSEGKFVLVRQYRHAIGKVMTQFPAGGLDKHEALETGALRELKEETGYTSKTLVHLGTYAPYATKMTGVCDVYLAKDATFEHEPAYDEREESEVIVLSQEELLELAAQPEVIMVDLFACLFLALRHLQQPPFTL